MSTDLAALRIIEYPDPRLRIQGETVTRFDAELAALARRMGELMREAKGVGLAAPQVGLALRLFVMNVTDDAANDRAFVNPTIHDGRNPKDAEEGCLSIPDVRGQIRRAFRCRIVAQDLSGAPIELEGEDLVARVWQHETDHLNGILIIDRMGPSDQLAAKKTLRELEAAFEARQGRRSRSRRG